MFSGALTMFNAISNMNCCSVSTGVGSSRSPEQLQMGFCTFHYYYYYCKNKTTQLNYCLLKLYFTVLLKLMLCYVVFLQHVTYGQRTV